MKGLIERRLIEPIKSAVAKGKPLFGICLGMQLLMTESEEFGKHDGLNLIKGKVVHLKESLSFKIPHIGWNEIYQPNKNIIWDETVLDGMKGGTNFYFVHSYMVSPKNHSNIMAITKYGDNVFCSVVSKGNVHGCQFHPERSGEAGLKFYKNIINLIKYEKTGNTRRGKKS
jgi:imidazole glycerol-phosphate synthase subunit HisH